MDNPCIGCDVGWGSISSAGSMSCRDECERLKAWEAKKKVDKPRICEVLGVEPYEKFAVGDFTYWIDQDGDMWLEKEIGGQMECGGVLCTIINHPERIIRKPRFTEQNIKDAKMVKAVFGENGIVMRLITEEYPYTKLFFNQTRINGNLFPSIKEGQEYSLNEIIGSETQP